MWSKRINSVKWQTKYVGVVVWIKITESRTEINDKKLGRKLIKIRIKTGWNDLRTQ